MKKRDEVVLKRISKNQGKICHFCRDDTAIWTVICNGISVDCCGSKHCLKKAKKSVS